MLTLNIKLAFRNLIRNKAFSLINLAGLAIGMACTMLILLWVYGERTWDRFLGNYEQIHQVLINRNFNGEINTGQDIMFPLGDAMKERFPQVEYAAVTTWGEHELFSTDHVRLRQRAYTVGTDFFRVFDFDFVSGNPDVLRNSGAVVLSERAAKALFGSTDVLDRTVRLNNNRTMVVKGVVRDVPAASTLQFDAIMPFNPSEPWFRNAKNDWVNSGTQLFVKTRPGTNGAALAKSVQELIIARTNESNPNTRGSVILHPMSRWRLYSEFENGQNTGGRIGYVRLFTWIALIILVIACVNFMNLSTARSEKRAREVGIRKTLGSARRQLLLQFLVESMVLSLLSFLLACGILYLVLPIFGGLLDQQLVVPVREPAAWTAALGITFITGLLAGSYPAFYLSSFNPLRVLKGIFGTGRQALMPRKVLVTAQFIISIILISATIIVFRQLQHVKDREIGYDPDNLIMVSGSPELGRNFDALKNELLQSGLVASVNRTAFDLTNIYNFTPAPEWPGRPEGQNLIMASMSTDVDFVKTTNARLMSGRDFRRGDSAGLMLNRAAVEAMGLKDPIGMQMRYNGGEYTVLGVVDNMIMNSPYEAVDPMLIFYSDRRTGSVNLRLAEGAPVRSTLNRLEGVFKKYNPEYPFEYRFTDEVFNQKFVNEELLGNFSVIFSGLAIFICCLGLFGLVSFSIERRSKEIGIRRVLGASLQSLLLLISREFLVLVALAFLVAIPVAWWALSSWLENFSYRTQVHPLHFVAVGGLTLLIALLTVCLNASKAARAAPVKTLRTE